MPAYLDCSLPASCSASKVRWAIGSAHPYREAGAGDDPRRRRRQRRRAHRNHRFPFDRGVVRLAPIYDVAPTIEFVRSRQAGLFVCGEPRIDRISVTHLSPRGQVLGAWKEG
jgi:hypothetical protein